MVNVICFVITIFKPFIAVLTTSTTLLEKILKIKKKEEQIEDELKDTIVDSNLEELEKKNVIKSI